MTEKFCKDCLHQIQTKPLNRCGASKYKDLDTGEDKRVCMIERIDGIGRCGSMANNFTPRGDHAKVHSTRGADKKAPSKAEKK